MQPDERALRFACGGDWLYGVLSMPRAASRSLLGAAC
jgi:hypothetical protein